MINGSVNSIETFGLVDGPGIRTVIFLNKCLLRCKYCHNPETWQMGEENYNVQEIVNRVLRNKPYFGKKGGVTFSGGEPLLQQDFVIETCKELKKHNIHIALDTAGITDQNCEELLQYVDLVILDVKHITKDGFKNVTQFDYMDKYMNFLELLKKSYKEVWIRQVIIPGINDNEAYVHEFVKFLRDNINNITNIEFLPYHKLGIEKYHKIGIKNQYENKPEMDKTKCQKLNELAKQLYFKKNI